MSRTKSGGGSTRKRPRNGRRRGARRGSAFWRWTRRLVLALVVVILIPVALTGLYAVPFFHPVSTLMLKDLVTGAGYDRRWVDIDDIAPVLVHSVMMSEDGQFCSHDGVDWGALDTVIDNALEGERTRGASTIPMQTVKNLFLWQGRSYVRKAIEIPLALMFDFILPKKRIMEIYLNIVELAPHVYGVEAAAGHYFGRSAAKVTRRQAALLAVTLPNPAGRDPENPSRRLSGLAATIEKRARGAGDYVACLK